MLKLSTNTMLLGRQCLCESPVIVKYCCRAETILSDSSRVTLLGRVLVIYLRETHIVSRRWAAEGVAQGQGRDRPREGAYEGAPAAH